MGLKDTAPFPTKQLISIAITMICEPIAFTSLFPFVYFMVKDLNVVNEDNQKDIGYYVGIISSCFALAGCFTSLMWGHISDKIGRRPVTLNGLLGSCIFMFLFGISPNYTFAVVTRTLCGVLNGNNAIRQSMLAEISNEHNRSSMIGPFVGGYLYDPAKSFPFIFGNSDFLKKYPYFLPCAVCSIFYMISFIYAYFYLEETSKTTNLTENDPLLALDKSKDSIFTKIKDLDLNVWYSIISSCGLFFMFTINDELLPIWSATPIKDGGLSFNSSKIGKLMLVSGFFTLFSQMTLCSKLQELFGVLKLYRITVFFTIIIYIIYPFCNLIKSNFEHSFISSLALYLVTITRVAISVFSSTSLSIIIVQNASKNNLGLVTGLNYSLSSIGRALGPLICGFIWSLTYSIEKLHPYNAYFNWFFLAFIAGLNLLLSGIMKSKTNLVFS